MLGRRATMRGPPVEKARGRMGLQWFFVLLVIIGWRELTYQKPKGGEVVLPAGDVGVAGTGTLLQSGVAPFGIVKRGTKKQKAPWYQRDKWKNVTAGLVGRPQFNLSDAATLQFAGILEGMLVPFSRIPGESTGMGSSGMVGARMMHIMGEKAEFMLCTGHVRIVEGQVYFRYGGFFTVPYRLFRFHQTLKMLQDAVESYGLQDIRVEFFLNLCDQPFSFLSAIAPRTAGYPIFSMHGATGTTDITVPDPMDLSEEYLPDLSKQVPWAEKVPKAVFRGPSSNYVLGDHNWRVSPRFRLHRLSKAHPDLLDARLMRFEGHRPEMEKFMARDGIQLASALSPQERSGFKYEIVADGGVGTSRTCGVLLSNQVMIRQESAFWQFFDPLLQPGVHFLPTTHHFQNLPRTVRWAQEHDLELQEVVRNANQAARVACTWEGRTLYWAIALAKYHEEAMEDPQSVKAPAQLCRGKKPRAILRAYSGQEGGAPACDSAEASQAQPPCAFYCSGGLIPKASWQWLSAEVLDQVDRVGPRQ